MMFNSLDDDFEDFEENEYKPMVKFVEMCVLCDLRPPDYKCKLCSRNVCFKCRTIDLCVSCLGPGVTN